MSEIIIFSLTFPDLLNTSSGLELSWVLQVLFIH
jgi:hypothetical protein